MGFPKEISTHEDLRCCHVWRSIGTHIWFEYGIPKIELLKNGRRTVHGELTLHVESDNWRLIVDGQCPLNSDTVSDGNFRAYGPRWFLDKPLPQFTDGSSKQVELSFSPSISLIVFPDSSGDVDYELSIRLPDGTYWGFLFNRGWFLSS